MCPAGNRLSVPELAKMVGHSLMEVWGLPLLRTPERRKRRWLAGDETGQNIHNGKSHGSHLKTNDRHNKHADLKGSSLLYGRRGNRALRRETKATREAIGTEST
jgi:hypothetical protein